jgi:hypothetical protein
MGTVALGLGQTTAPTLEVTGVTATTITVRLTAGTDVINGFDVFYEIVGQFYALTSFYGTAVHSKCADHFIQPGESVEVVIGATDGSRCRKDFIPRHLISNRRYFLFATPHNGGSQTPVVSAKTLNAE